MSEQAGQIPTIFFARNPKNRIFNLEKKILPGCRRS
jgi:hypothetical protein